jgi:hypothetical protein
MKGRSKINGKAEEEVRIGGGNEVTEKKAYT